MRRTEKDEQGNWCLRGVPWKELHAGAVITAKTSELLYGALWKLMEYEETGLNPEEIDKIKEWMKRRGSNYHIETTKSG